nr:unnamed protein product [Callosobruchus analis]
MARLEEEEEEKESVTAEDKASAYYADYSEDDDERFLPFRKFKYRTNCCYGLSMDLLENVAQELEFDFRLYIVADGMFGSKTVRRKTGRARRDMGKKVLSYR